MKITVKSVQKQTENFSSMTLSVPFFSVRLIFFNWRFLNKKYFIQLRTQKAGNKD